MIGLTFDNVKVDRESQTIVCDELLEDLEDIEELRDSLPEHQPRLPFVHLIRVFFCFVCLTFNQVCGVHEQARKLRRKSELSNVLHLLFTKVCGLVWLVLCIFWAADMCLINLYLKGAASRK